MNRKLVSIVMPTYNRAYIIKRAIESVIAQTYKYWELIIVDDASSDNTCDVVNLYKEKYKNIIYIKKEVNEGANKCRNYGISISKGELIAFIDSDNYWHEEKLQKQIDIMQSKKDIDICFCSVNLILNNSNFISPTKKINCEQMADILKKGNVIDTNSILIKKKVLAEAGLFDETLPRCQEYELMMRLAYQLNVNFFHINEVLVTNQIQRDSISNDNYKLARARINILRKHEEYLMENKYDWIASIIMLNVWDDKEINTYLQSILNNEQNRKLILNSIVNKNELLDYEFHYLNSWIDFNWKKFENKKIAVYGIGNYGKKFINELEKINIDVIAMIDENGGEYKGISINKPGEKIHKCEIMIVSILGNDKIFRKKLQDIYHIPVVSLEQIVLENLL